MTTNHHTPHSSNDDLDSTTLNSPLSELDSGISGLDVLTTKGDILTYDTANARLAVGSNGEMLMADSGETTGLDWQPGPSWFAILKDVKATTTDGGSASAATWNVRDLNTESSDVRGIVSLSSNRFTPISGTYKLKASAPAFDVGLHRLGLYNQTQTSYVEKDQGAEANTGNNDNTLAHLTTVFTANGTDAYEIHHYTTSSKSGNGLGKAVNDGANEVYLVVELTMVSR